MASGIYYSVQMEKGIKKWGISRFRESVVSLCRPEYMNNLAKGYRYYINQYVPKKSGALRRSAHPVYKVNGEANAGGDGTGSVTIYWGDRSKASKYAHYQFIGDVYGPNKAIFNAQGEHIGWRSPTGFKGGPKGKGAKHKTKMGWKMGNPGSYTLSDGRVVYIKGYTTKGTSYNWIKVFKEDDSNTGEAAVNIRAARYLYEASCVISGIKPVGGQRVYRSWNQIKGRID